MGAVQKLATVVIVGMVALSTLLVIYLADEPNRMSAEAVEQEDVAIERGISTYLQNCVVCHGPAGEGYSEPGAEGTGRIGMPLGGDTELGRAAQELNQSEDPVVRQERYDLITKTIHNGRGLMPAWGRGAQGGALLNDEQIHELATDDPERRLGSRLQPRDRRPQVATRPSRPRPLPPVAGADPGAWSNAQGGWRRDAGDAAASDQFTIEAHDIFFQPDRDRSSLRHRGDDPAAEPRRGAHNFSIDALNISVDIAPGETKEVKINAPEGEYEFYCNVPGHKEAGMVGTLISRPMASADQPATANENAAATKTQATAGSRRARCRPRPRPERHRVRHLLRTKRSHRSRPTPT